MCISKKFGADGLIYLLHFVEDAMLRLKPLLCEENRVKVRVRVKGSGLTLNPRYC